MTGGFTSVVVGEGGISTVYLIGFLAAVKVHRNSECLHHAFPQELNVLLRVHHPHIVRLLAFCDQRDEGVLVLEFAPNENLYEHVHGSDGTAAPMPWARRCGCAERPAPDGVRGTEARRRREEVPHPEIQSSVIRALPSFSDDSLCNTALPNSLPTPSLR